jgi:hypothetical protein
MLPNLAGRQKTAPLRPGATCVGTNGATRTCDFSLVSASPHTFRRWQINGRLT